MKTKRCCIHLCGVSTHSSHAQVRFVVCQFFDLQDVQRRAEPSQTSLESMVRKIHVFRNLVPLTTRELAINELDS
jgi:hypothetical protein